MSFQAYLDNIEDKTGLAPQEFIDLAVAKGFSKTSKSNDIVKWLVDDYELGRGHEMAIVHIIKNGPTISDKHVDSGKTHSDPSNELDLQGKKYRNK